MAVHVFRTVRLNALGWATLLTVGSGAGVGAAVVLSRSVAGGAVVGATVAFGVALLADELRDRRTWFYVPVIDAESASDELRSPGIRVLEKARRDVAGRIVEYVAVRERDSGRAITLVGMPHHSRRGGRRWRAALGAMRGSERPSGR